jgi:DNA-binding transcriptional regulator YhcF (GntR family)
LLTGNLQDERPIFIQLAELLEDGILSGAYGQEEQVPSITEISVAYKINPATALKGVNLLVEDGLIYKKRGLGMFVAAGAREKVAARRRERFYRDYILPMLEEARRLGVERDELNKLMERGYCDEH